MTAADCWADLEAKARAATPGPWRVDPTAYADIQTHNGRYDIATTDGVGLPDSKASVAKAEPNAAFIAAANPATILKLIEAARHSQPGAEGGWQPIETAPRDGTEILVWTGRFVRVARYIPACGWMAVGGRQVYARPITLWMPLPASPQKPATSTDEKVGR